MKERKSIVSVAWSLVFAVCFPISVFYLSRYSVSVPIALLIIIANSVLFGIFTVKLIQSIKVLDEVQIRIQLEAVSVAFLLSLLLVMILGLLGLVGDLGLDNVSYLFVFPSFSLFYIAGLFISKRKYR